MRPLIAVTLITATAGAAWLLVRSARSGPADEPNWASLPEDLIDMGDAVLNQLTEEPANVPADQAAANIAAFLAALRASEGTASQADPFRVVFGYGHTLQSLADHPYFTGEWLGAPFAGGNWSTAAGAYQINRRTWAPLKQRLQLPDFSPASQDAAAIELVREKGALEDVKAGRFGAAVNKVRRVWASLPGAGYGQGERDLDWLTAQYESAGGNLA